MLPETSAKEEGAAIVDVPSPSITQSMPLPPVEVASINNKILLWLDQENDTENDKFAEKQLDVVNTL